MKTYKQIIKKPSLEISYSEGCESPRSWTTLGHFITIDRRYESPDKNTELEAIIKGGGDICNSQAEHIEYIKKHYQSEKVLAVYPIVKYEHGGVSYSLGTKHGFDYSNNGFYVVTNKKQKELGTSKKYFEEAIKDELEVYNKYVNGEVLQYCLYDENGDFVDSCGGFYSIDEIRESLPKEWENEDLNNYFKA